MAKKASSRPAPPPTPSNVAPTQSTPSGPADKERADASWKLRAGAVLKRKKKLTPFEDRLGKDSSRSVELCRFLREQWGRYRSGLHSWYARRVECLSEMNDIFQHREAGRDSNRSEDDNKLVFSVRNESLNIVAAMAEFAAAQAEQDIFGGDPWFAAKPVGRSDHKLSDLIQSHLRWKLKDGKLVYSFAQGIQLAAFCGEVFTKAVYESELEEYEEAVSVLFSAGKPVLVGGQTIPASVGQEQAQVLAAQAGAGGPFSWGEVFQSKTVINREGVCSVIMNHADVAFREDAPELCLDHTGFYHVVEMTVAKARRIFNLSKVDAIRLALACGWQQDRQWTPGRNDHIMDANPMADVDQTFGEDYDEQLLNMRVQLVECWQKMDFFGDGRISSAYLVFPPAHEDWLIFANYLGNISPKATTPVFCHAWERKSGRLYGKGFIEKYGSYQRFVDGIWNSVAFRNEMHANPITGYHPEMLEREEDDSDLKLEPGLLLHLKPGKTLKEALEFAELPDLDNRSIELMQTAIQIMQLRSGITSASQGDMAGLPQNNTATGIRQLMSRAAVLLKKPIRNLRRSFNSEFALDVKLIYANFNVMEAFVVGEGENQELLSLTPKQVADLEVDVVMLLTQEQNQTKFESSQAAITAFTTWITVPEIEKGNARILFLQALKALEFDQVDDIIREAAPTLLDAISLLPQQEQANALAIYQAGVAAMQAQAMPPAGAPAGPGAPTPALAAPAPTESTPEAVPA